MLGRLFRVLVCFLVAMQPASKSLSTDLYYRLADTGQPVLVTLVDTAAAELANSARIADAFDTDRLHENNTNIDVDFNNTPVISEAQRDSLPPLEKAFINESHNDIENDQLSFKEITERSKAIIPEPHAPGGVLSNINDNNVRGDNNTAPEAEIVKKPDAVPQASEPQEEIPSFSEWAQKQLEEAEKNKENVLNHSSQTTQGTVTSTTNLKVRSKNYASPDCGAKIIAANPEAGSAEFILSPGKDEYMLNTCNSRIWFIVELCEAIQAKKVDLANFELFSSTPKNFSVSVSDRFPTRDWAGVGQFIAKDERDIQTFNLHPHLFGKFVKVEMHSYYGSEHYCPISLFRVYGTSEFEVFETENSPHSQSNQGPDDDDDDDEEVLGLTNSEKDISRNLFGSARDAVMSIMKKAAQVLVKSGDSKNSSVHQETITPDSRKCRTPSHIIVCDNCSNSMFTDVYDLISCQGDHLKDLMQTPTIHSTLCNTDICQQYGLDFKSKRTLLSKTEMASYISALFMPSYVAALCNMLAIIEKKVVLNTSYETDLNITSNLTIDKKTEKGTLEELIHEPFVTCGGDDITSSPCKETINDEPNPDTVPLIESSAPLDVIGGTIADIKPTKTLQKDSDILEPSVITVQTSSESHLVHNVNSQSSGYGIEASIKNNVDQVSTETLSTKEPEKIHINESLKEIVPETMTLEPDKEKPEFSSITVNQDSVNDVESLTVSYDGSAEDVKLSTQDQLSLDKLLSELEQGSNDPATPAPPHSTAPTLHQGQGQKESVFLRLSNRIKALERNMSLSGQYLEELSRRYKKQVEEMQKTFDKTLHTMNEESKKSTERDQKNTDEMLLLQQQLAQISTAVNILLTERESWFGNTSLFKMMMFQIFITVLVTYIFRRNPRGAAAIENSNSPKKDQSQKVKIRRRSVEGAVGHSGRDTNTKIRRSSEEALHIARTASDISAGLKVDKKKRKRKSSVLQRSYSVANPTEVELSNINIQLQQDNEKWERPDMNAVRIDFPVALDEAEFIVPETEPIDFNKIGEVPIPRINGLTPKKEFPKTNGSIFGNKSNEKKTGKVRRLSSPAFFKSALGRQSQRSISNDGSVPTVSEDLSVARDLNFREIKSEERQVRVGSESPQLSVRSSIGDISQASSTAPIEPQSAKNKRSKGKAFKNLFKKVF